MAGKVLVDGKRVDKPGTMVAADASVQIKGKMRYVGKGGYKLAGALDDFGISVEGKVALDAGASTGGFTHCLLTSGAAKVYAVDTGYGQLAGVLRADPRVVNLERTNIGELNAADLVPPPNLGTVDLSYLSLTVAIPIVAGLLTPDGELVCLVKPLFEVEDTEIRRSGVFTHPDQYRQVLHDLISKVEEKGYKVAGLVPSRYRGNKGTLEFFLHLPLQPKTNSVSIDIDEAIEKSVTEALKLPPFAAQEVEDSWS